MSEQIYQSVCSFNERGSSIGRGTLPDAIPSGNDSSCRLSRDGMSATEWCSAVLLHLNHPHRFAFPWIPGNPCCGGGSAHEHDKERRFYGFNHVVALSIDGPAQLMFDPTGSINYYGSGGTAPTFWGEYAVRGYIIDIPS